MTIAKKAKISYGMPDKKMADFGFKHPDNQPISLVHEITKDDYATSLTGAKREKLNTERYDYMPARIVNESYGRVAHFGAKKYADRNWEKGLPQSQIASSLQRHLWAYMDGENTDPESSLSHLDHVLWNAVALVHGEYHNLCDDRLEKVVNIKENP